MATSESLEQVDKSLGLAYRHNGQGYVSSHIFCGWFYEKYPGKQIFESTFSPVSLEPKIDTDDTRIYILGSAIISLSFSKERLIVGYILGQDIGVGLPRN